MKLKDMLNALRIPCTLKIRDLDNDPICSCDSTSKGAYPYLDLEVVQWFVYDLGGAKNTICVLVNDVREKCEDIPFTSQSCPSCGNSMWGYENGKIVCAVCGNKIADMRGDSL